MMKYSCKTKIISGAGALQELKEMHSQRLLVVSDPYFAENGWAQRILELSGAAQGRIYDKVAPNPTVEQVALGTAQVRSFQPDTVVALGGGSAIDCAKAMVYFSGQQVRFVAVPTTSGSGSEVTDFAVLSHKDGKYPLVDEVLQPDVAILDSALLEKLPRGLIADTGYDVISHALEALVSTGGSLLTDALACQAVSTVLSTLVASYQGNLQVREQMHLASTMAAMAFNGAGLGLCHGLSHALGGLFHVPHGRLNAILLPAVVEINSECAGEKYAWLARQAGLGGTSRWVAVRNLKNALIQLRRQLNLPETLAQAGISPVAVQEKKRALVEAALGDPCTKSNPFPVTADTVAKLLQEVTGRG